MADRKLHRISTAGDNLILHITGDNILCFPDGRGNWIPARQPALLQPEPEPAPEPTPDPPTDPGTPPVQPSGKWVHPLPQGSISSPYGPRSFDGLHAGVDISSVGGTAPGNLILAPCDLKITVAVEQGSPGALPDAGSYVKGTTISGTPYTFNFFHMVAGSISVSVGQTVAAGTPLGREGATGNITGTHLHLECWPGHKTGGFRGDGPWYYGDGTPIDPVPVLRANGVNI